MKSIISKLFSLLVIVFTTVSCSWEELPSYEEADISGVQFYYRWASSDKDPITNEPIVKEQRLDVSSSINKSSGSIECKVSVPAAGGDFNTDVRDQVNVTKLWGQVSVSKAARILPIEGSASLGTPDDWSKERQFKVTSASGDSKIWSIRIVDFEK